MSNFTPGPWIYEDQGPLSHGSHAILTEAGWGNDLPWIATVEGTHVGPKTAEEVVANSRLVAAAPEIYEALFKLRAAVDGFLPGYEYLTEIKAVADAAIAKAVQP